MCDLAGYRTTNDITEAFDIAIKWFGETYTPAGEILRELSAVQYVINGGCDDISKTHVEAIHRALFGYGLMVDPTTYSGPAVMKANLNAQCRESVVACPLAEALPGFVYQKLIVTRPEPAEFEEYRVPITGFGIPCVVIKRRPLAQRFDRTAGYAELTSAAAVFNAEEIALLLEFCRRMGLDFGDLDVLRDRGDGRIYVIDANPTPGGPGGPGGGYRGAAEGAAGDPARGPQPLLLRGARSERPAGGRGRANRRAVPGEKAVKILFASRRPVYPLFLGGAELSFFELARGLGERGHQVLMMGEWSPKAGSLQDFLAKEGAPAYEWRVETEERGGITTPTLLRLFIEAGAGLTVAHTLLSDFTTFFQDGLATFEPQVVCTYLDGSYEVVEFCKFFNIPVLHFARDTFHSPNFHVLRENETKKRPTACVANSRFLSQWLRKTFDVDSFVLYPIVDAPRSRRRRRVPKPGRRVMISNPAKVKGGELMLEVAAQLPEIVFVLVPGWGARFGDGWLALPNVEIHPWPVLDMRKSTKPSIWWWCRPRKTKLWPRRHRGPAFRRAGGGVAAFRLRGGLGDSAILIEDFRNPAAWRDAIRELLGSDETLARLVRRGKRNIRRFERRAILGQFERILESVT